MTNMCFSQVPLTAQTLSGSVIAPTLTPFDEFGAVTLQAITDQARRISHIGGIAGIAVNTTNREREMLSFDERVEVIRRTRAGLAKNQLLLVYIGVMNDTIIENITACKAEGADAVITFPAKLQKGHEALSVDARMTALADLIDQLPLPVILADGISDTTRPVQSDEIAALAQRSRKVIGFEMGSDDDVLHYDQNYYALKALDRSFACLPSSEGALFHNLNTGSDGVLSCLAYVAPHEVAALYAASRGDRFHEAQALHNRLAPLIGHLTGHDAHTREMIYREIAHARGLLVSAEARGINVPLCPLLLENLHKTLDDIALKPISWV